MRKSAARLKSASKRTKKVQAKKASPSEESGYEEDVEAEEDTQASTTTSKPQVSTSRTRSDPKTFRPSTEPTSTPTRSSRRICFKTAIKGRDPVVFVQEATVENTHSTDILTKPDSLEAINPKPLDECDTEPEIEQAVQPTSPIKPTQSKKLDTQENSKANQTPRLASNPDTSTLSKNLDECDTEPETEELPSPIKPTQSKNLDAQESSTRSESGPEQSSKTASIKKPKPGNTPSSNETESENEETTVKAGPKGSVHLATKSIKNKSNGDSAESETEPEINSSPVKPPNVKASKSIEEQSTECETSDSDTENNPVPAYPITYNKVIVSSADLPFISPTILSKPFKKNSVMESAASSNSKLEQVLPKANRPENKVTENVAKSSPENQFDTESSSDEVAKISTNKDDIATKQQNESDSSPSDSDEKVPVIVETKFSSTSTDENSADEKPAKTKKLKRKKNVSKIISDSESENSPVSKSVKKLKPDKKLASHDKNSGSESEIEQNDSADLSDTR